MLTGINTLNRRINALTGGAKELLDTPRKIRKNLMETLHKEPLRQGVRVIEGELGGDEQEGENDAVTDMDRVVDEGDTPPFNFTIHCTGKTTMTLILLLLQKEIKNEAYGSPKMSIPATSVS